MDNIVHYRGVPIAITSRGYRVGKNNYTEIGMAKTAIAREINSRKNNKKTH